MKPYHMMNHPELRSALQSHNPRYLLTQLTQEQREARFPNSARFRIVKDRLMVALHLEEQGRRTIETRDVRRSEKKQKRIQDHEKIQQLTDTVVKQDSEIRRLKEEIAEKNAHILALQTPST